MGVAGGDYDDDGYDNLFVTRSADASCFTTTGVGCINISGGGRQKRQFGSHARPSTKGERLLRTVGGKHTPRVFGFHDSAGRETPARNPGRVGDALQPRAKMSGFNRLS